uniref:Uncharacterized protein n=1 Tax=Crocodylus porosus TaxID=8502 RepID=A0A7M4FES3_CROPO
ECKYIRAVVLQGQTPSAPRHSGVPSCKTMAPGASSQLRAWQQDLSPVGILCRRIPMVQNKKTDILPFNALQTEYFCLLLGFDYNKSPQHFCSRFALSITTKA